MPNWSNSVPQQKKHMGFDLRRTPEASPLEGVVTSENLIGCDTHWWGGRTLPCERPDCDACNASMPYRWHSYVSVFCTRTHAHFIFEATGNAAKAFEDYREAHGTLRGCFFRAERPKRTKNGKVVIATRPANLTQITLPSPPDVMLALTVIWKLPTTALRRETAYDGGGAIKTNPVPLRRMRKQPDNAPEPPTIAEALEHLAGANGKPVPCPAESD